MARCRLFALTFVFFFAVFVQTLEACKVIPLLSEQDHPFESAHHANHKDLTSAGTHRLGSPATIHCFRHSLHVGPMMQSSRVKASDTSTGGVLLPTSDVSGAGNLLPGAEHFGLESFSHQPPSISFPAVSSFQAFLSIFQI